MAGLRLHALLSVFNTEHCVPCRLRAVLADQDVLHRIVAPSRLAGSRPRYSLVWKLAFLPKRSGQVR